MMVLGKSIFYLLKGDYNLKELSVQHLPKAMRRIGNIPIDWAAVKELNVSCFPTYYLRYMLMVVAWVIPPPSNCP